MAGMNTRAVLTSLAAALALAAAAAPAAASPSDPGAAIDPGDPPAPPNAPPTARASFRLAPRADDAGKAWSTSADNYRRSYVHPASWYVSLDGCGSTGGTDRYGKAAAVTYEWRLEPLDGQRGSAVGVSSNNCRAYGTVNALGRWHVELTVRAATGQTASADAGTRRLRDVVIVALGDSYVSGEGNPEEPKRVSVDEDGRIVFLKARWTDKQCHRSRASWAMRAAQRFEDSNTAVTFLNYGCSGATTSDVMFGGYDGIQPVGDDRELPAQLEAARAALGDPLTPDSRPVHSTLVAMGVNDLGFSDVMRACASFNGPGGFSLDLPMLGTIIDEPCSTSGLTEPVRKAIRKIPRSYDMLGAGIAANLKARSVQVVEYPSRIITNGSDNHGGCGALLGFSPGEARWISRRGDELNAALADAAGQNGWDYVDRIRNAFRGHGYCAGDTWFRSFSGSKKLQGNRNGMAHPIWAGHRAAGEIVAPHIPSEEETLSLTRVRITFESLRASSPGARDYEEAGDATLASPTFGAMWHDLHRVPVSARQMAQGTWVTIPEDERTTTVATYGDTIALHGGAQLPRIVDDEITGYRTVPFFVTHRRGEGWRPGEHTVGGTAAGYNFQLRYRVTVLPSRPLAPDVGPVEQ
jgi:hypothetical protein